MCGLRGPRLFTRFDRWLHRGLVFWRKALDEIARDHRVAEGRRMRVEAAGVEAFQINFHGNRNLEQLIDSMECFMREVKPRVT